MIVAVDEGLQIQVLKEREGRPGSYRLIESQRLIDWPADKELDLEGVAANSEFIYAVGSHSQKRKSVDMGDGDIDNAKKAKKNRQRLFETAIEPSREYLFRFELENNGKIKRENIRLVTLRDLLANHPILRRFQVIPSKENGIDIEGIAVGPEGQLYLGFRGPVLRGGYVPILIVRLEEDDEELKVKYDVEEDIRFVNLGGRGVRDMVRISGPNEDPRFLILAGPVGDGPASYQVYEWDGHHAVPGRDKPDELDHAKVQCEVPRPEEEPDAKAEGIAVIEASADELKFIIAYDSASQGAPIVFTCPRSPTGGEL